MDDNLKIKIAIVSLAVIAGLGSLFMYRGQPDNPVEQTAEFIIKQQTGMIIDFTPEGLDE